MVHHCPLLESPVKMAYLQDVQAPLLLNQQTQSVSNIEQVRDLEFKKHNSTITYKPTHKYGAL